MHTYFYNDDHNTLYVSAKIEQPSSAKEGNYYVNYLFKYSITDKEYEELSSLLEDMNCNTGFLVQEMERLGRMKVVSKAKFAKTAYKSMTETCRIGTRFNPNNLPNVDFDIIAIDNELATTITIRGVDKKTTYNSGIGILEMGTPSPGGAYIYDKDILQFYTYYSFHVSLDDANDFTESYKTIKCYEPTMRISSYSDLNCLK